MLIEMEMLGDLHTLGFYSHMGTVPSQSFVVDTAVTPEALPPNQQAIAVRPGWMAWLNGCGPVSAGWMAGVNQLTSSLPEAAIYVQLRKYMYILFNFAKAKPH